MTDAGTYVPLRTKALSGKAKTKASICKAKA